MTALSRLRSRYDAFFFTEEPVDRAVYLRIAMAVWTAVYFLTYVPYLRELYDDSPLHVHFWIVALVLGKHALGVPVAATMIGLLLIALGLFGFGVKPRACHVVVLILIMFLWGYDRSTQRGYGLLGAWQWALLWLLPYDRLRDDTGRVCRAPRWGMRLLMLNFSLVYLFTVCAKVSDGGWLTGDAVYNVWNGRSFGKYLLSAWLPMSHAAARYGAHLTLATELFIGLGLWGKKTVRLAVLACVGLHLGMALSLRVTLLFYTLMWLHLPLFWPRKSASATVARA